MARSADSNHKNALGSTVISTAPVDFTDEQYAAMRRDWLASAQSRAIKREIPLDDRHRRDVEEAMAGLFRHSPPATARILHENLRTGNGGRYSYPDCYAFLDRLTSDLSAAPLNPQQVAQKQVAAVLNNVKRMQLANECGLNESTVRNWIDSTPVPLELAEQVAHSKALNLNEQESAALLANIRASHIQKARIPLGDMTPREILRHIRQDLTRLTQKKFGEALDCTPSYVANREAGLCLVTPEYAGKIKTAVEQGSLSAKNPAEQRELELAVQRLEEEIATSRLSHVARLAHRGNPDDIALG